MRIFELMYFTHGNVPEAAYSLGLGLILYASVTIPRLNFLSLVRQCLCKSFDFDVRGNVGLVVSFLS